MLWTATPDGKVDWVNRQWREYTGLSVAATAGDGWSKAIHPDDHVRTAAAWKNAHENLVEYEVTYRWMSKNGDWRWFLGRAVPIKDSSGEIIKWFGSITDVHEAKLNEESLELRVAERTQLVEKMAQILSDFVESGDFREASKSLLSLAIRQTSSSFGFIGATVPGGPAGITLRVFADQGFTWSRETNRELYEKIMRDYANDGFIDFPRLDNLFGYTLKSGQVMIANDPQSNPHRSGRAPAGHPPLKNFLGVPVFKGGVVVGMIGLANKPDDYSDEDAHSVSNLAKTASVIYENYRRQQREKVLIEQRTDVEEKLKSSNQSLLDLAYFVSHELQAPLRIIKSDLGLLSVRYSDRLGSDADQFISNAREAADVVNRMIDDLWEYARIERPHIRFEPVELDECLQKTILAIDGEINKAQAKITSEPLPTVKGERRQLSMLLRQLLLNSIAHNDRTPLIDISRVESASDSLITICISDNGVGFEPTENAEIFKMFRKLRRESPGTGMGLAIAMRIVEFHGGKIWAESEPGRGSKFFVTLPL